MISRHRDTEATEFFVESPGNYPSGSEPDDIGYPGSEK